MYFLLFSQMSYYLMRYGEESQQVSFDMLTHYINASRDMIEKAVHVKTEDEFEKYVHNVRLVYFKQTQVVKRTVYLTV